MVLSGTSAIGAKALGMAADTRHARLSTRSHGDMQDSHSRDGQREGGSDAGNPMIGNPSSGGGDECFHGVHSSLLGRTVEVKCVPQFRVATLATLCVYQFSAPECAIRVPEPANDFETLSDSVWC